MRTLQTVGLFLGMLTAANATPEEFWNGKHRILSQVNIDGFTSYSLALGTADFLGCALTTEQHGSTMEIRSVPGSRLAVLTFVNPQWDVGEGVESRLQLRIGFADQSHQKDWIQPFTHYGTYLATTIRDIDLMVGLLGLQEQLEVKVFEDSAPLRFDTRGIYQLVASYSDCVQNAGK